MPFLCLAFRSEGRSFSSGTSRPNFRVGGATGFRIESKTGRASDCRFFFAAIGMIIAKYRNHHIKGARLPAMSRKQKPFWIPASNYYVLAVGLALAFFFLVWGILHESGERLPWVTAGISASMLLCGAAILREVILRRARGRWEHERRREQSNPRPISLDVDFRNPAKLTLEENAEVLAAIKQKSDAARVLGSFSAGHREVFELCRAYIVRAEHELKTVKAGSPRLAPLLNGRSAAAGHHRYHMLQWAEIEARKLASDANLRDDPGEKIENAEGALKVVDTALNFYPAERSLLDSRRLLLDMIASLRVSHAVAMAETAARDGNYKKARELYGAALRDLAADDAEGAPRRQAAAQIAAALERLPGGENDG